jgi:hypothetical protein
MVDNNRFLLESFVRTEFNGVPTDLENPICPSCYNRVRQIDEKNRICIWCHEQAMNPPEIPLEDLKSIIKAGWGIE